LKTLPTRVISSIAAIVLVVLLYFFFRIYAFQLIILAAVIIGGYEIARILFIKKPVFYLTLAFYFTLVGIFGFSAYVPDFTALIFAAGSLFFCLVCLLFQDRFQGLDELSLFLSKSILGFFYVGLLPSFAFQTLSLPQGETWFLALLSIVFAGDIGAYFFGLLLGEKKLMPKISPKKTVEGSIGGALFSVIAGIIFCYWLQDISAIQMVLLSLTMSLFAQFGDLFESLLKRVAHVKDSGTLMPGHGGVLDRIDGVLFACPILLLGAKIFLS
jgi:phosphatidate cytidylyltransferase